MSKLRVNWNCRGGRPIVSAGLRELRVLKTTQVFLTRLLLFVRRPLDQPDITPHGKTTSHQLPAITERPNFHHILFSVYHYIHQFQKVKFCPEPEISQIRNQNKCHCWHLAHNVNSVHTLKYLAVLTKIVCRYIRNWYNVCPVISARFQSFIRACRPVYATSYLVLFFSSINFSLPLPTLWVMSSARCPTWTTGECRVWKTNKKLLW